MCVNSHDLERESKIVANLMSCFIVCCKPVQATDSVIEMFPMLLTLVVPKYYSTKSKSLKIKILDVVLAMIYYDTVAVLTLFNNQPQIRDDIFTQLFGILPSMDSSSSRRLIVVAFSNLLSIPVASLPDIVRSNLQPMFQQVIRELVMIEEEADEEAEEDTNEERRVKEDNDSDLDDDEDLDDDITDDDDVSNKLEKNGERSRRTGRWV